VISPEGTSICRSLQGSKRVSYNTDFVETEHSFYISQVFPAFQISATGRGPGQPNCTCSSELRERFKSLNSYVCKVRCLLVLFLFCICLHTLLKVLLQAGYVLEPNCNNRGNQICDSGRQFYDGKYKKHLIICFRQLEIGSRPWAKIRLTHTLGRIGPDSPKTCCLIAKAA
jgi:hypothetical protein